MPPESRTASVSFAAMGGVATVIVNGPSAHLEPARRRLGDLEAKWSRFRPDSEVSRLNAARWQRVRVSTDTQLLVERAVRSWGATGGAFDPTVLDALMAWGYDRDFGEVHRCRPRPAPSPAPGLAGVEVDAGAGTVCLGGAGFDSGGIGKGLAADIVATELVEHGACAALVNVAGDLRVAGSPPEGGWVAAAEDPISPERDLFRLTLAGGALATSSDRRRRWAIEGGHAHHLIDPATGEPAVMALAGVTVLAGEAWWAEAMTKAVLIGGIAMDDLSDLGVSAIGRSRQGVLVGTADLIRLCQEAV